jgi:hypothetical protein
MIFEANEGYAVLSLSSMVQHEGLTLKTKKEAIGA